jgi:hypothetical protein
MVSAEHRNETQAQGVLRLMIERPGGITQLDALQELGCMRLPSRIHELRGDGVRIESRMETLANGKRVARYRLLAPPPGAAQPMQLWPDR